MSQAIAKVVDARFVAPRDRHSLIFQTLDALKPGETLLLVNDHLPRPLYYEFLHERTDQFTWEPVEEGPDVWRVRIGRKVGS